MGSACKVKFIQNPFLSSLIPHSWDILIRPQSSLYIIYFVPRFTIHISMQTLKTSTVGQLGKPLSLNSCYYISKYKFVNS